MFMYAAAKGQKDVVKAALDSPLVPIDYNAELEAAAETVNTGFSLDFSEYYAHPELGKNAIKVSFNSDALQSHRAGGNTALHAAAFYAGRTGHHSVYDLLKQEGALDDIKNNAGLTPPELIDKVKQLYKRGGPDFESMRIGNGFMYYTIGGSAYRISRLQRQILEQADQLRRTLGLNPNSVQHEFSMDADQPMRVQIGNFIVSDIDPEHNEYQCLTYIQDRINNLRWIAEDVEGETVLRAMAGGRISPVNIGMYDEFLGPAPDRELTHTYDEGATILFNGNVPPFLLHNTQ